MSAGGNPEQRPDQALQPLSRAGVGPAPQQGLIIGRVVIVFGPAGSPVGLFIYTPGTTPGLGNPPIYSISNGPADPFGNPVVPGFVSYAASGYTAIASNAIVFSLTGDVFAGGIVPTAAAGGSSGVPSVIVTSPSDRNAGGANSQAIVSVTGESADGTVGPYVYFGSNQFGASNIQSVPVYVVGGGLVYAFPGTPGGLLVAETWHTLSLAAGWSTVAGQPVPSYRLLPDGNVQITGAATHANFVASTQLSTVGALPAAYQPVNTQVVGGASPNNAGVSINTAGTVSALPPAAGTTVAQFNGAYPLNI